MLLAFKLGLTIQLFYKISQLILGHMTGNMNIDVLIRHLLF